MTERWPWLLLVALGVYHGLNPAMGWLFAVALGLHRRSRAVVLGSLIPIALGHLLAITIAASLVIALGVLIDVHLVRALAGGMLILWALYHALYGTRHRLRVGMQTGFAGLLAWSFLMANAHGAGLMLTPALIPICLSSTTLVSGAALPRALAAIAIHMAAMLFVMGVIASAVYAWIGVGFLRRGWINLDLLWIAALGVAGAGLIAL
ncbi:MAG TPA: hypothetical protein VGU20_12965 [Stellaceae bacterium]|nr:hypothetical protein [Stellaceae bacterium]